MRTADRTVIEHDIEIMPTSMINAINVTISALENYDGDLKSNNLVNNHTIGGQSDDYFISSQDNEHNIAYLFFEYTDKIILFKKISKSI